MTVRPPPPPFAPELSANASGPQSPAPPGSTPGTPQSQPQTPRAPQSQPQVPYDRTTPPMGVPIAPGSMPNATSSGAFPAAAPSVPRAPVSQPAMPAVSPAQALSGTMSGVSAVNAGVTMSSAGPPPGKRLVVRLPQVGTRLVSKRGEYEVRRILGSGEFGAVYDCVGPFDQVYALKMIRPANRPYQEVYAEWARETQRLLSLRHPNVVYMHDAFEQDHLFFMALEKCEHSLSEMLGTPMQEGLVIELARQLLAAVQFLHDNDIVHDDLHPGNVLIVHAVDRPTVKISDFGISHELRGAPAVRPNVVHHKIMAPEVVASGYTSKQSDIYQVGLLMFWMLMGEPAIPLGVPYQELVRIVAEGIPRRRAEGIGTPLGGLIAKMLRRRDAYRYTSAKEVWADLRQLPSWQNRQLFPIK